MTNFIINKSYSHDVLDLENDAIIECMLAEIEMLEMKHQCLIMQLAKKLHALGIPNIENAIYLKYGEAFMEASINENYSPKENPPSCVIGKLKITLSVISILFEGYFTVCELITQLS